MRRKFQSDVVITHFVFIVMSAITVLTQAQGLCVLLEDSVEKKLYANVIAITVMIAALCTVQIVPSAKTVIDVEIVAMDVVMCVMQSFLNPTLHLGIMTMTSVTVPNVTDVVIVAIVRVVTMMNMATTIHVIVCLLITFVTSATTVDTTSATVQKGPNGGKLIIIF